MPNGKPGDHPLTDLLGHGMQAFPDDIGDLIQRLAKFGRAALDRIPEAKLYQWERGQNLEEARALLTALLEEYENK